MSQFSGRTSGRERVGPYLAVLVLVLVGLYAAVFFLPGSKAPRLGLDLQGGTRVVLTPVTDAQGAPDSDQLEQARRIIEQRVNGLGVAEAEVTIEGNTNIVVTAPGEDTEAVKAVGQTAELQFRVVQQTLAPAPAEGVTPDPADPMTIVQAADCATPEGARLVADSARQSPHDSAIISCALELTAKYLLGPVEVQGTDVAGASASTDNLGAWKVDLQFTSSGQSKWTALTEKTVNQQVAIVLDGLTISAPVIQSVIVGDAQITGNFTEEQATNLANSLNYGALPLTFTISQATTVSATLGLESLKAGLIAGAIGLSLVLVYCMFYYRLLGLVVILSLVVSGLIVYAGLVLLGRSVGFTLTLAGVAGLIVAIGITADSFIVLFERVKDEVRAGRSVRTSIPMGWTKARRTIVAADVVSLLAAVILYYLALGPVRGFAFTLGLSTVADLFIVFFFTYPVIVVMSRWRIMRKGSVSGLPVPRAAQPSAPPDPGPAPRESVSVGKEA